MNALEIITSVAERGGGRLIVVDAVNPAAESFYRHHDFTPTRDGRLVMKIATARAALD
ncbi:MAG: hypothetical protein Q8P38_12100 [Candidatus Nanopelagicales bacterium]|nr:hypothetical protein [Candidatus Nanopelagicales bacterium]